MRRYCLNFGLIVGLLAITSAPLLAQDVAKAETDEKYYKEVQGLIDNIKADKQALSRAVEAARERTVFCRACHGKEGIAKRPNVPNLAGQNALYLYTQLDHYSGGRRYDFMMAGLAKTLTREDILNIALFYSGLPSMTADPAAPQLIAAGKETYLVRCVACHQENAYGRRNIPRLAGQQSGYIERMLKEFRNSTGRRSSAEMSLIAHGLSDEEISALASYLADQE
jgi:cytochrome c553